MEFSHFFVFLLQIVCGIVGGLCSYLVLNWVYRRMTLDHEYRLSDLEGRVNREVKIRAQQASVKSRNLEQDFLTQMKEQPIPEIKPRGLWVKKYLQGAKENGTV